MKLDLEMLTRIIWNSEIHYLQRQRRSRTFLFFEKSTVHSDSRDVIAPLSIMHAPLSRASFCSNYEFPKRNITQEKIMVLAFFLKYEFKIRPPPCCQHATYMQLYYHSIKELKKSIVQVPHKFRIFYLHFFYNWSTVSCYLI